MCRVVVVSVRTWDGILGPVISIQPNHLSYDSQSCRPKIRTQTVVKRHTETRLTNSERHRVKGKRGPFYSKPETVIPGGPTLSDTRGRDRTGSFWGRNILMSQRYREGLPVRGAFRKGSVGVWFRRGSGHPVHVDRESIGLSFPSEFLQFTERPSVVV